VLIVQCLISTVAFLSLLLVHLDVTRHLSVRCKKVSTNESFRFVGKEISPWYFQDYMFSFKELSPLEFRETKGEGSECIKWMESFGFLLWSAKQIISREFFHYKTRLENEPVGNGLKIKCYSVAYSQHTDWIYKDRVTKWTKHVIKSFRSLSYDRSVAFSKASASSFKLQNPLVFLRSSSSCLRILPPHPVTSIFPAIFPSITCFMRQVVRCDQSS
jgi:hypothetical protein